MAHLRPPQPPPPTMSALASGRCSRTCSFYYRMPTWQNHPDLAKCFHQQNTLESTKTKKNQSCAHLVLIYKVFINL